MLTDGNLGRGLADAGEVDDRAAPVPQTGPQDIQLLVETLTLAKAEVDRIHNSLWRGSGTAKAKNAYRKWDFGEGEAYVLQPADAVKKLPGFFKKATTPNWQKRTLKKQRYFSLERNGLDAGLHEFIRSAVRHYQAARTDWADLNRARVPPERPLSAAELTDSTIVAKYASYHYQLGKARRYLDGCLQLSVFCYEEIGLLEVAPAAGQAVGVPRGPLLQRVHQIVPLLEEAFAKRQENALALKARERAAGVKDAGGVAGPDPLAVPAADTLSRGIGCSLLLQSQWKQGRALAKERMLSDPFSPLRKGLLASDQGFMTSVALQLDALENPGLITQALHHHARVSDEADRREDMEKALKNLAKAAKKADPTFLSTVLFGFEVKLLQFVLWPLTKAMKLALESCFGDWLGSRDPNSLVTSDGPAPALPSLGVRLDETSGGPLRGAVEAAPALRVKSAADLDPHQLRSLAVAVDSRIVATARHLMEAHLALDALESLQPSPDTLPWPTAKPPKRSQIVPGAPSDGPQPQDPTNPTPLVDGGAQLHPRPVILTKVQAEAYCQYAHHVQKALVYLNLVTLFECSLDQALQALEASNATTLAALQQRYPEATTHER